jgi:hypothetical protein
VSDLAPLKGIPLKELRLNGTPIRDLGPLKGMPLASLNIDGTKVSDLVPLENMPLHDLSILGISVSDVSPLHNALLTSLIFTPENITSGIEVLRAMKSMVLIGPSYGGRLPPADFWKKYDAGEFGKPAGK